MTVKTVFASDDPDVLAAFAENERREESYRALMREWQKDYPDHKLYARSSNRGRALCSLGGKRPGEHWRQTGDGWVPYKNHQRDDALLARWNASTIEFVELPGLPVDAFDWDQVDGSFCSYRPGWRLMQGYVWATWGCSRSVIGEVGDQWTEAKLSAYHLAFEALAEATP